MTWGPVVSRQLRLAEAAAAGEQAAWQRAQDAARAERAEAHEHAAVQQAQYRAEGAGDHFDALSIARGEVPARTVADVLRESAAVADPVVRDRTQPYGSEANPAILIDGVELPEPVARSSGWPGSEAELERLLSRARGLHDDLIAVRVRCDYAGVSAEARAQAERGRVR